MNRYLRSLGARNVVRAHRTMRRITRDTPAAKVHGLWQSAEFHFASSERLYDLAIPEAQA